MKWYRESLFFYHREPPHTPLKMRSDSHVLARDVNAPSTFFQKKYIILMLNYNIALN